MCLTCRYDSLTIEEKIKMFKFKTSKGESLFYKTILKTIDNRSVTLTEEQISEIIEHALYVIVTGFDASVYLWSIQWVSDYKPKTFKNI